MCNGSSYYVGHQYAESYFGMHLHIGKGSIVVSMESYVESLLRDCGVVSGVSSPATGKLFKVNADSILLGIKEAKWFNFILWL